MIAFICVDPTARLKFDYHTETPCLDEVQQRDVLALLRRAAAAGGVRRHHRIALLQ